jgi:ribosomal protein S12 methylthiotransferase
LEKGRDLDAHEKEESLRGTDKFGKTKAVVAGRPRPRPVPLSTSPRARRYIPDYETPRFRLTPETFRLRQDRRRLQSPVQFLHHPADARHASQPHAESDIVAEAKALLADGVKELNLISQDSTYYGLDLRA